VREIFFFLNVEKFTLEGKQFLKNKSKKNHLELKKINRTKLLIFLARHEHITKKKPLLLDFLTSKIKGRANL